MLKELREKAGITQLELALALGFSNSQFISNIERGLCELPVKHFRKAAKLFKVKPDLFIDDRMRSSEMRMRKVFELRN